MTGARLARLRGDLDTLALDAFVLTHPPNLRYITGLKASAGAAVVTAERCVLVVDFRYATAAQALVDASSSLQVHVAAGSLDTAIAEVLRELAPERIGVEGAHLPVVRYNRLSALLAETWSPLAASGPVPGLVPTERVVERARAVKDAGEVATLRAAGERLSSVAGELRRLVQPGRSEIEVAALIEAAMRAAGFEAYAFETIVASGPNSALPHARPTGRRIAAGDGVVLDFGGVYDGYCVDLTRTLEVGRMSSGFRHLFDAVEQAQAAAIATVRPGVEPKAIDAAARDVLTRHGLGEAFGHGTGHGLGLEVHEEPRISPLAPDNEPVQAGMVFTIEPGAYVPGVGGVRIEDDILVVDEGCERLTKVPIRL